MLRSRLHVCRRGTSTGGFTLLEIMLVVAIIAVSVSMVLSTVNRRKEEQSLDQAVRALRGRILEVRAMSKVAGASLDTNRLVLDPGCPAGTGRFLWISIDPGTDTYTVPQRIEYDATRDVMSVSCGTFNFRDLTAGVGTFSAPAGPTVFGFGSNGRLLGVGPPPFIQVQHTTQPTVRYGFRILPSGVLCSASDPAVIDCDKDLGT